MTDPAETLIAEINRLRAGEDPTPAEPGTKRTPGQCIHRWNQLTGPERLAKVAALYDQLATAERCFLMGHESLRHELDAAHQHISRLNTQLIRVQDLAHHWIAQAEAHPTKPGDTPTPKAFAAELAALCGQAIIAALDKPDQPDTDPQTTTAAHHETPQSARTASRGHP